jgi:hypothetical protein
MAIVSLSRHGSACGVAERLKLDQAQVKPEHFQAKWIFKPSGIAWRLGKCDRIRFYCVARW